MTLKDTIIEFYKQQKLTKTEAYQLLNMLPQNMTETTTSNSQLELRQCLMRLDDETHNSVELIALWVYFIHIVNNTEQLQLMYAKGQTKHLLHLLVDANMSFDQLKNQVCKQLSAPATNLETDQPVYAFFDVELNGADSDLPNQDLKDHADAYVATAHYERSPTGPLLKLYASQQGIAATRFDDWPDVLQLLFKQVCETPDKPMCQFDHLPERHKILLENYNRTRIYLPEPRTFCSVLTPALASVDQRIAVKTSEASLSYAELKCLTNKLAHLLRRLGARPNKLIPVICERDTRMPALLQGVILSGAGYVPLETDYPQSRVRAILEDTQAEIILTDAETLRKGYLDFINTTLKAIVCVDDWSERRYQGIKVYDYSHIDRQQSDIPSDLNSADDIAYVIFTSGSTGKPKGVVISHVNLINTLIGVNNQFNVNPKDQIICFSSYSFDLSVWDIFGAFLAGATVFIPTKEEIKNPHKLMSIIQKHKITIWDSVPTGMSQLLLPFLTEGIELKAPSLRLVMLSGEFIPLSLPENIRRYFPNARISSLGGATEGTVWSIFYYPVDKVDPNWKSIPYGIPLGNQGFYVLNEAMQPCAIGQKGMLHIAGYGVAKGYYRDPEKTGAAFLPNPFDDDLGPNLYRTGDLGLLNADGVIEILGRADFQVKVRGFRVELGEVESQLTALPFVDQAVVLAKRDKESCTLQAFYTSKKGEVSADEIRRLLLDKLPEYMVPSQFIYLHKAPVGATGKLDRKALENFQPSRAELGQEFVAAETELEQTIANQLQDILKIDSVGVEDDFFLLGGDSLLSLQYVSILKKLGLSATPLQIQKGRTIRGVLREINQSQANRSETAVSYEFALAPMQAKFIQRQRMVNRNYWNQSLVIRFDERINIKRLEKALNIVFKHHDMLRAGLKTEDESKLRIEPFRAVSLKVIDLSRVNPFKKRRRFRNLVKQLQAGRRVTSDKIVDQILIKMSDRDMRLVWVANHLIVDAHCWRILVEDLAQAYQKPDKPLIHSEHFSRYVELVDKNYASAAEQHLKDWAKFKLDKPYCLPAVAKERENLEKDLVARSLQFSKVETDQLQQCVQERNKITLHLMLLTSLLSALSKWEQKNNGQVSAPAVDIISNGREIDEDSDFSRTIGWFATHNPFRVELPKHRHLLIPVVAEAWAKYRRNMVYFVEGCNRAAEDRMHPLHDYQDCAVLYNFLGSFDNLPLAEGWQVLGAAGFDRAAENRRTHQIEFEATVFDGRLRVNFYYSRELFSSRQIRKLSRYFRDELLALSQAEVNSSMSKKAV